MAVDDGDDATFTLDLVEGSETSDDDEPPAPTMFREGDKITGSCTWEYPFSLKILKRTGDHLQGTIKWDIQESETKFKGTITKDGNLKFEEYEMLPDSKQNFSLPVIYNGTLKSDQKGVEGNCGPSVSAMGGIFKLSLP